MEHINTTFAEDISHLQHLLKEATDPYVKDRIAKQIELLEETEERYNRTKKDKECQTSNTI